MSLYLAVFSGETELAGVEVGSYAEFNAFRQVIAAELEGGAAGTRFPTLMRHSDCDGAWSAEACALLRGELRTVAAELQARPVRPFPSEEQRRIAAGRGLEPASALECFLDVDGEFLLERLHGLVAMALHQGRPILFQ